MANQETYPLHRCIFRNDVESLDKNLKDEEIKKLINQKDNHGNTPIHLALMLDRRNCILSLLRNGCDTITRNVFEWNPLEEATMLGDVDLIEKISKLKFRDYCIYFNKTGTNGTMSKLDEWNQNLPYCHYKAQIKIKSKIPLLSKIGIKDIVHFYKDENNIRFNTGIAGIEVHGIPRVINGNLSFIVNRLDNGLSKIYMLDNKNKRYTELFPYIPQTVHDQYIKSKTDVKTLYKFFIDNTNLTIKKKTSSGFSFKNNKKRTIRVNNKKYNTELFKIKNIGVIIRKRDNEQVIGDFKSDIKTTIADIDQSRNRVHKTLASEINNIISDNGIGVDEFFQNENEENNSDDESDSDSDDSDIENDNDDKSVSSHSSSSVENVSKDDQKKLEEMSNLSISDKNGEVDILKKTNNMTSMIHSITENYYSSTFKKSNNNDTKLKDDNIKRIPISEEEYFDPSNTESLHMGRVMEISEEKRHTKKAFKMWLTKEDSFPLNINDHLRPVIDFLCSVMYDQINGYLYENVLDRDVYKNNVKYIFGQLEATKRFPLKVELPLLASTTAQFKLIDVETDKKNVPEDLFKVPDNYVYDERLEFRFNK